MGEDEDQDVRLSFVTIPEEVLKDYAKRTDIEGLKFSPNIWAKRQMRNIEKQVMSAIMRGQSAETLSKDLVQYLKGGSVGMGHSIRYKTMRLARTITTLLPTKQGVWGRFQALWWLVCVGG